MKGVGEVWRGRGKLSLESFPRPLQSFLNLKQHFEVFLGEGLPRVLTGDDGLGDAALHFLKLEDLLFHGILADQLVGEHLTRLADTVGTVVAWLSTAGFHHGS